MAARTTSPINHKALIPLLAYLACILFITVIYRESGLGRQIQPVLFWSFAEWFGGDLNTGFNIVLNVLLFVPLGYLLAVLCRRKVLLPVLLCLAASLAVEAAQYISCRGGFDVDDLFTNTLGGAAGAGIYPDRAGEREIRGFDGCRVFTLTLPAEYHITAVRTGCAVKGIVRWEENFRP